MCFNVMGLHLDPMPLGTMAYEREIDLLMNIVLKIWDPLGDIWSIWGWGR